MKHCIIHRRCVEIEMNSSIHPGYKDKAKKAYDTIENLIETQNVVLIDHEHPEIAGDFFQKGDEVMISGAYLGMCLQIAYSSLVSKGCKVSYHPKGCI
jgi:carbonic anhydrase/acetyltransferase-like protein (isoleucine patch superfamily)